MTYQYSRRSKNDQFLQCASTFIVFQKRVNERIDFYSFLFLGSILLLMREKDSILMVNRHLTNGSVRNPKDRSARKKKEKKNGASERQSNSEKQTVRRTMRIVKRTKHRETYEMEHSGKDTSWNESKYQNKKITLLLIVSVSFSFLAIFYHFH